MTRDARYALPDINHQWLTHEVLGQYPGHKESTESVALIESATLEYIKLWHLAIHFPEKRVVAPGPIAAILRAHWQHRDVYFHDCLSYFNRYIYKEFLWGGRPDVQGTLDTTRAYIELYENNPPEPWKDITDEYDLAHAHLRSI